MRSSQPNTSLTVAREIRLRPRPQRLQTPHLKQHGALGLVDRLHRSSRSYFLRHRKCHSRL